MVSGVRTLIDDNNTYCTDYDKAEHLNAFFSTQSTLDAIALGHKLPNFPYVTETKINNVMFTEDETKKILMNLNVNKASGPDGISIRLLKKHP